MCGWWVTELIASLVDGKIAGLLLGSQQPQPYSSHSRLGLDTAYLKPLPLERSMEVTFLKRPKSTSMRVCSIYDLPLTSEINRLVWCE